MVTKAQRKRRLIGAGVAVLAVLGLGIGVASAAGPGTVDDEDDEGGATREPDTTPLSPDPSSLGIRTKIDVAICECVDSGIKGEAAVTRCVAVEIWSETPWPPISGDHESHIRAWNMIKDRVVDYIRATLEGLGTDWCDRARGPGTIAEPPPKDEDEEKEITGFKKPTPIPPLDLSDFESDTNYPRDGILHLVESGEIFLGTGNRSIIYRALASAGYLAALEAGETEAKALEIGESVANNSSKRIQYLELIQCSPWNDALYGTWGYGNQAMAGPHGRAIRMMKYHPDNRQRIIDRLPPMRNIRLGDPSWRTEEPPRKAGPEWQEAAKAYEYLWLVKLDYKALYNDGIIAIDPTPWEGAEDGLESKIFPPPLVSSLGASNVPPGTWGCPGMPVINT